MIRILMVDDSASRVARLRDALAVSSVSGSAELQVASSAVEARNALAKVSFDLLLLDINIPARADSAPSSDVSISLLEELVESSFLRKPKNVIGITMHDDSLERATETFSGRLWSLVRVDDLSSRWIGSLINAIEYLVQAARLVPATYGTDLLVVTALASPEMSAVHSLPWNWDRDRPVDRATFVREGTFICGGRSRSVVTSSPSRMGMVATALRASKLIAEFRPRFCVMVGICAGVRGVVETGDIILADPVWDYQSGKIVVDESEYRLMIAPHQVGVPEFIRSRFEQLRDDRGWLGGLRDQWPEARRTAPSVHIGPLASGSPVLSDGNTIDSVRQHQQRQLLGIDMETYGLYCAGSQASHPAPTCFGIKSVCDFASSDKSDRDQAYASYTSARAMGHFFETYYEQIWELAGTT